MKKEDFIIGKWYVSSAWSDTKAVKFSNISNNNRFCGFESIKRNETYDKNTSASSFSGDLHTYKEVPISEIAQYLPKDHPDLQNIIPQYVKCIKQNGINKHYPESQIGRIFKVIEAKVAGYKLEGAIEHSVSKNRFILSTKEEYNTQFKPNPFLQELVEFPEKGFCTNPTQELREYLSKTRRLEKDSSTKSVFWTKSIWKESFLDLNYTAGHTHYPIEQLNKFINIKNKENEKSSSSSGSIISNNEIPRTSSENRRRIISGTVAIRCGRQQSTTGTRPKGNITIANTGTTRISSTKISKSVVIRENY